MRADCGNGAVGVGLEAEELDCAVVAEGWHEGGLRGGRGVVGGHRYDEELVALLRGGGVLLGVVRQVVVLGIRPGVERA